MRTEDGYIISRCLNGDPSAFGLLVDKYKESIYALSYSKIGNFHDAEDITQEVFIKAYQKLNTLRRWDSFLAWLYSITSNLCRMWLRSHSRRPDSEYIEDDVAKALSNSSLESYRDEELIASVHEALDSLPEIHRQVLTLFYLGGMSTNQIARFLGTSSNTITQRLYRARSRMKEEMLVMMNATFKGQKLPSGFTLRIVEILKNMRIQPVSPIKALPWGLSLVAGIITAIIGLNINVRFFEQPLANSFAQGESKVLNIGVYPVDIMRSSETPNISSQQMNGDGTAPSLQNALFMTPQAEGGTWTKKADMPTDRTQLSISEVNGKIYVIGGSSNAGVSSTVEEYDPATNKWTKKADMPTPRYFLATSVLNGKIYAIGGERRDAPFSIVEEYDPTTDKWARKASLSLPRTCLSACTANGKIYAIGGMAARANWLSADVEEYDPVADKWTRKADMPTPRMCLCTVVLNDKIYAIGGLPNKWPPISAVEVYDPVSDTWTKKADIATPRTYFASVAINDRILIFGGTSDWGLGDATLATTIEEYDPDTDKWTVKGNMPEPRMYCPASPVNGKIYVIGGLSAKNQIMTLVEEYDPKGESKSINFRGSLPTTWGDVRTASNR
jgi:RNA polymerase sigma factor (sigma-70 family)